MKKNISINLQGIIFHIEEDGYEILSRYLAEVKAHFSGYRGHEEIVADIESRIAELFVSRLSASKQVIALADVEQMIAKMGRVRDFQAADEAEEEEEILAGAVADGTAAGHYTSTGSARPGTGDPGRGPTGNIPPTAETGPKRLYRDMANRKIAGVAAGVARYFAVNPLWVRLIFLGLLFIRPLLRSIFDFGTSFSFRPGDQFDLGGFAVISYIVLWIVLPKRYDTVSIDEDPTIKKLYRDVDNGKIGGVSSGLAAYFRVDVVLIRILFFAGLLAGGFSFVLYIVLWILVPEAKTASDKLRMRGDAVTLSSLDNNLRSQATETGGAAPTGNRPIGMFIEDAGRTLRPAVGLLGTLIRLGAGLLLVITGFLMLLAFTVALGVGLGLLPESQGFIHTGPFPAYLFTNSVPTWVLLTFYATVAIPTLAMLLLGLGLLLRRAVLSRLAGLSLLGLWLLSIVGASFAAVRISRDFQMYGEVSQTQRFGGLTAPTLTLDSRYVNNEGKRRVDLTLAAADSGQVVELVKHLSARGVTEREAARTAATSMLYGAQTPTNGTLLLDRYFTYQPDAVFRDQELDLTLRIPRDRTIRLTEGMNDWLNDDNFVNNDKPDRPETHRYRLAGSRLECVDCAPGDLHADENDDADTADEADDSDDGDFKINVDVSKASFPTALSDYGSGRRTFGDARDFREVEASGVYRVYVRAGDEFRVEAAGDERDLRRLSVDTDGDRLRIRNRDRNAFWSGFMDSHHPVLVRVTLPRLDRLELSGACQADVAGFNSGNLEVEQSGASAAALNADLSRLTLDLSGASRIDLRGRAANLNVDGSGASQINALQLDAGEAAFDLSGACNAKARVRETLHADLSGASEVRYAGNPTRIEKDVSRGASLKQISE